MLSLPLAFFFLLFFLPFLSFLEFLLRTTVEQRLAFKTDRTDTPVKITVSVWAVGTTPIEPDIDPRFIIEQAEEALRGAQLKGYNRIERVALVSTSVSLLGATNLLKSPLSVIRHLVRTGQLVASRQGRYVHIDRASVQRYYIDQLARMREQLDWSLPFSLVMLRL